MCGAKPPFPPYSLHFFTFSHLVGVPTPTPTPTATITSLDLSSMSSYLPLRHPSTHGHPGGPGGGRAEDMHHAAAAAAAAENVNVNAATGYMEHFLNIPEICPTSNYRTPRSYYAAAMNSYQAADACRMEALQQRNHEFRMGLQPNRSSFYPNMNMTGMRFGDGGCGGTDVQGNCGLPQPQGQGRPDSMSPCTKVAATEGEPPSFYPWMSIVGKYQLCVHMNDVWLDLI